MPIYHFNVHSGISSPDSEGTEMPDITTARKEAVKLAGFMLIDEAATFWQGDEWHLDVTDDRGLVLFTLTFFGTDAAAVRRVD